MKYFFRHFVSLLFLATSISALAATSVGKLYTMSNATTGNAILIYDRLSDGSLSPLVTIPTNGVGTGGGLGNQSALALSSDGFYLLAVNAGSNSVSAFRITRSGLALIRTVSSDGINPVSVTEDRGRVFVLNAGNASTPGNIMGFQFQHNGELHPMYYSKRPLSDRKTTTGAAQISFSNSGKQLIVTEKATNLILTYRLNAFGVPSRPVVNSSAGVTPFGFAVGKRNQFFVSNAEGGAADISSLSSYRLMPNGRIQVISPEVSTKETAACWVTLTPDGRYAFTTNTASGTVSSFRIDLDGNAVLADSASGNSGTGSAPIDMAISPDSRYLYTLNSGSNSISSFAVGTDGELTGVSSVSNLPAGANGLVAQ